MKRPGSHSRQEKKASAKPYPRPIYGVDRSKKIGPWEGLVLPLPLVNPPSNETALDVMHEQLDEYQFARLIHRDMQMALARMEHSYPQFNYWKQLGLAAQWVAISMVGISWWDIDFPPPVVEHHSMKGELAEQPL